MLDTELSLCPRQPQDPPRCTSRLTWASPWLVQIPILVVLVFGRRGWGLLLTGRELVNGHLVGDACRGTLRKLGPDQEVVFPRTQGVRGEKLRASHATRCLQAELHSTPVHLGTASPAMLKFTTLSSHIKEEISQTGPPSYPNLQEHHCRPQCA